MRDEHYVLGLCDNVLGRSALRQHRFHFLVGDPGRNGARRRLPVDGYYPELALVIEYRERQHNEGVAIMDRRLTISGCTRGEQRRRYDERRQEVLPANGLTLIEIDHASFVLKPNKRLKRILAADMAVVGHLLRDFLDR